MGKIIRGFELRTDEGQVLFRFNLVETETDDGNNFQTSQPNEQEVSGRKQTFNSTISDSMTEPQKRFLFRILAEHGIQGEIAHQELKNAFQVKALTEVGKFEASKMIERLLGEGIGWLKNGPSIQ